LYLFGAIVNLELESYIQLSGVFLRLANIHVSFKYIISKDFNRAIEVKYCLLPMCLLLVWGSRKRYFLLSMAELAVKPAYKTMKSSLDLGEYFEGTIEVQLAYFYCLQINVIELRVVCKNILMINGINYWLREHPFLHALHTDTINTIPKILNNKTYTSFFL